MKRRFGPIFAILFISSAASLFFSPTLAHADFPTMPFPMSSADVDKDVASFCETNLVGGPSCESTQKLCGDAYKDCLKKEGFSPSSPAICEADQGLISVRKKVEASCGQTPSGNYPPNGTPCEIDGSGTCKFSDYSSDAFNAEVDKLKAKYCHSSDACAAAQADCEKNIALDLQANCSQQAYNNANPNGWYVCTNDSYNFLFVTPAKYPSFILQLTGMDCPANAPKDAVSSTGTSSATGTQATQASSDPILMGGCSLSSAANPNSSGLASWLLLSGIFSLGFVKLKRE